LCFALDFSQAGEVFDVFDHFVSMEGEAFGDVFDGAGASLEQLEDVVSGGSEGFLGVDFSIIGNDLGVFGQLGGEGLELVFGYGQGETFCGRPGDGVDLNAVGRDALDTLGEFFDFLLGGSHAAQEEHLEPVLSLVFVAQIDQAL